jgi:hypothetical protein
MREIVFQVQPGAVAPYRAIAEPLRLTIEAGSLEELQHEAREALIQHFGPAHVTYRVRMRRAANHIQPLQRSLPLRQQSRS